MEAEPVPEAAPKPPTRAEMLDKLLGRLAKAGDAEEAQSIASLVEQIWMHSGSDTADLLMARAMTAMNGNRHDVAEALLDQILALQPDWAEAWNKRATLRFLDNDDAGSMEDIGHVLTLEPRHFGALSGMGFILERHGENKAALTALRRVLELYPEDADIRKAVDKLTPAVEGQGL
jgi:tetratricopeptide (TPR) repeat protein